MTNDQKLDQQAIEELLASMNTTQPEPAPAPQSQDDNKQLNQDDIEALLASMNTPQPEPTPSPAPQSQDDNKQLNQDDMEALLASMNTPQPEPTPSPAPQSQDDNKQLNQDDIEALLASMNTPQPEPTPAPAPQSQDDNKQLNQDDIEALLASMNSPQPETEPTLMAEAPQKLDHTEIENVVDTIIKENPNAAVTTSKSQVSIEKLLSSLLICKDSVIQKLAGFFKKAPPPTDPAAVSTTDSPAPVSANINPVTQAQAATVPKKQLIKNYVYDLTNNINKKALLATIVLLALASATGGFIGYHMAQRSQDTLSPLDSLTKKGITFEEKNLVAYAGYGNKEIVQKFLAAGMSADAIRKTDGWTPLIAAAFYKRDDIVSLLLDKEIDVNHQDIYGETALMYAASMGDEKVVQQLINHGANPNLQDKLGRTALLEANSKQQAKVAEILKEAGASKNIEPGQPPIASSASSSPLPGVPTAWRLSPGTAGAVKVGMSLQEVQKVYPNTKFSNDYLDGNNAQVVNVYINKQNNPAMKLELSRGKIKLVSSIHIYDEHFKTGKQIGVNSTVNDLRNQYTISGLQVLNNSLFISVQSRKMLFELDLSKGNIGSWLDTNDPSSIPGDLKIKRIIIY